MKSLPQSIKTTKYNTAKYENRKIWKSQSEILQSEITAKYKNRKVKSRRENLVFYVCILINDKIHIYI